MIFSFISRLNTREKALLGGMIGLFSIFGLIILNNSTSSGPEDIEGEIASYQRALTLLSQNQANLMERIENSERIQEQLANNELQLHTFLERACLDTNVQRPSNYTDSTNPLRDASGDATITEHQTVATIPTVEPLNLSRLLNRIAGSDELVLLKAIQIRPTRGARRGRQRTASGEYEVRLTVATYRRNDSDDS